MTDYASSVPGSIGREKFRPAYGMDSRMFYVLMAWAFISLIFLLPVLVNLVTGYAAMVMVVLFLGWWAFFYKYLRSPKHIEKAFLFAGYLLRTKRSEHIIAKYTQPLEYLSSSLPVKKIHEGGLIEYYGKTQAWGVLLKVDPFRVSDDDLDGHQAQLTSVFNSLPEGVKLTVINTSYVDESQQFINTVRNAANDPEITRPQREHLAELHRELSYDDSVIVDWSILISVIFDNAQSLKDATVKMGEYVPGIVNGLLDAGLMSFILTEKTDVVTEFRKMIGAQIC